MSDTQYLLLAIGLLTILSFVTRAIPFIFGKVLARSQKMRVLETFLPAIIMLLLVIFEMNITHWHKITDAIPKVIALLIVIVIHLWRRNMILSIVVGTASYILLLHFTT